MKKFLKAKLAGLALSAAPYILIFLLLAAIVTTALNFFSGIRLFDEYDEKEYENVDASPETLFLASMMKKEGEEGYWDEHEYYGNFAFTKEDMIKLFQGVIMNNGDVESLEAYQGGYLSSLFARNQKVKGIYHATKHYYQYYWETWCVYQFDKWDPNATDYNPETGETTMGKYVSYKTPLNTEWDEPYVNSHFTIAGMPPINIEWGWHCGLRPSDDKLKENVSNSSSDTAYSRSPKMDPNSSSPGANEYSPYVTLDNKPASDGAREEYFTDELNSRYRTQWQPVYALCQMAASSEIGDWAETPQGDGGVKITYRLNPETLQRILEIFKADVTMGYDGAWASRKQGYAQTEVVEVLDPQTGEAGITRKTDYTRWDPSKTGAVGLKWDDIDKIAYTIEREGDWGKTSNDRTLYKRRLYKIPANSVLGASNGKESWTYYGTEVVGTNEGGPSADAINDEVKPDAVVGGSIQKYAFFEKFLSADGTGKYNPHNYHKGDADNYYDVGSPGAKTTNYNTEHDSKCPSYKCGGNMHAIAITDGIYEADCLLLEQAFVNAVGVEWSWDKFLNILDSLPDSDDAVARYEKIRDACLEAKRTNDPSKAIIREPIEFEDRTIPRFEVETNHDTEAKMIFVGKGDEKSISKLAGGQLIIPDVSEDWAEDEAVNADLRVNRGLSAEQVEYVFRNLKGYLSHPTSLITTTPGMAEALVKLQDDYAAAGKPFDLLGLLAIANNESAYGTSDICRHKLNFIGWGAVDWAPASGAWDFASGSICDALCKNFELIVNNYLYGKYDQYSYYKMRWNNGVHQYCTSTTWPSTNAIIRQQMMKLLGIEGTEIDTRAIDPNLTDYQNEKLAEYVTTYYSKGSFQPPLSIQRTISSPFGTRIAPKKGASTFHRGIDIPAPQGTPIYAATTGYVSHIGWISGGGYSVYIIGGAAEGDEENALVTKYMHMPAWVNGDGQTVCAAYKYIRVGDVVEAGQIIGEVGNSGVSTGPHLHFAVEINGQPTDPLPWLYGTWHVSKTGEDWVDGVLQ